jgi:hypothetical protein
VELAGLLDTAPDFLASGGIRPRVWTPARADFPAYQESSWPTDAAAGPPMQMADKIIMRLVEALIP